MRLGFRGAALSTRTPARLALAGVLLFGGCDTRERGSVYVTSGRTDEIVRLDARDGTELRRIPVDRRRLEADEPHAVASAPDGRWWYATTAHGQPALWKFERDTDRLVGRVDLPTGAAMIGITSDGRVAFIPDYERIIESPGSVVAVRLRDLAVTAQAVVCLSPHDAAPHPDGELVAVVCAASDELLLLDQRDLSVLRRVRAPRVDSAGHQHAESDSIAAHAPGDAGGARPLALAWSPDARVLAVALHAAGRVWLVDRAGATQGLIEVGAGPSQVAFASNETLLTANRLDGSLSIVDLDAQREIRRVALDAALPHGVALGDGVAYVAYEGSIDEQGGVVAVDLDSGDIVWRRETGRYVLGIAYMRD